MPVYQKLAQKPVVNVILFGDSGVGKSSLINTVMNKMVAQVSDAAVSCTTNCKDYDFDDDENKTYVFYDTPGLSEGPNGAVERTAAVRQLGRALKTAGKNGGVHLLVFVIQKGRITDTMQGNYELMADILCKKRVPVVLVITHCEQEKVMGQWLEENRENFKRIEFADCVSVCSSTGDEKKLVDVLIKLMKNRSQESHDKLWESVKCARRDGFKLSRWSKLVYRFKKAWNNNCCIAKFRWTVWPELKQHLIANFKMNEESAEKLAKQMMKDLSLID